MDGKIKMQKGSNKRLFILTQTHGVQIFGEIPFINNNNNNEYLEHLTHTGPKHLHLNLNQATKRHLNSR